MSVAKENKKHDRPLELGSFLRELEKAGRINKDQLDEVTSQRRTSAQLKFHLLVFIADQNLDDQKNPGQKLNLESLTKFLAEWAGQDYYHIDPLSIDAAKVTQAMSYAFTQRHKIMAVSITANEVVIASAEPLVSSWEDDLIHVLKKPIKRVVSNPVELQRMTEELYRLAASIDMATTGSSSSSVGISNLEQMVELGALKDPEANDQHVVRIVDWLLQYAFEQRASDIHIEPRREVGNVRFRIYGVLYTVYQIPMQVMNAVTSRLKILGRMNVADKRKPQDGRLKTKSPEGNEIELRLSTLPTAFGEKMVMRIFDPDVLLRSFAELGFDDQDLESWQTMIARKNGIILITGPTGSGKTTSLYSTLKTLATKEVNVCTIEDPIEMVESSFNQMQVQENIDLTFAGGIKALLRQDPDIIMIGEIRGLETAEMAVQAALTGHLVLSSLHTNDAPAAITRLLELGLPSYLVRATLVGVVAQRLVRTLCPHCKQEAQIDSEIWNVLVKPWTVPMPKKVYQPAGCQECRETGFKGRQGIYEVMPFTPALQEYAEDRGDLPRLRLHAYKEGMRSLRLSGALKVAAGITTVNEVLRVAPESQ
ncbi:MAG: GspE/PulE family protein [Gammaproteobacteria bacterium]|nr:GspE/PulE family protein [Gammaproteobacteria bacterium]